MEKCQKKQRKKLPKTTNHYKNHRYRRERFIKRYLNGDGNFVDSFIINRNHPMGAEIHEIRDNGLILIFNATNKKLITKKIARPEQIKKLYKTKNKIPPQWLLDLARWHTIMRMNYL